MKGRGSFIGNEYNQPWDILVHLYVGKHLFLPVLGTRQTSLNTVSEFKDLVLNKDYIIYRRQQIFINSLLSYVSRCSNGT